MDPDLLIVSEEEAGLRLDKFLKERFPDYSRSYFQSLIDQNLVLVNGERIKKGNKIIGGDEIEVEFALTTEITIQPEAIPLDILYEDEYLLAINKPPGMVVHPATGNWSGTFVNALLYHCQHLSSWDSLRPGIVHRLDKETSGLLLAAKQENAHRLLVEIFANRQIYKEYAAICLGNPGNRTISAPLGRHPTRRKEMCVLQEKGKEARTECRTVMYNNALSFVQLIPFTGRTHQLRVHMKWIGFPILGDSVYGSSISNKKYEITRQLLHAHVLRFSHPITHEEIELKAPLPQDMLNIIAQIKRQ